MFGAEYIGDPIFIQQRRHYVDPLIDALLPYFAPQTIRVNGTPYGNGFPNSLLDQEWFFPEAGTPLECPAACEPMQAQMQSESGGAYTELDLAIATDEMGYSSTEEVKKWHSEGYLYAKITDDPALLSVTELEEFYDDVSFTSPALYRDIDHDIKEAVTITPVDKIILEELRNEITELESALDILKSGLSQADLAQSGVLIEQCNQMFEDLNNARVAYKTALAGHQNLYSSQSAATLSELAYLPDTQIFEANEKAVKTIVAAAATDNQQGFTPAQVTTLESIIYQCPLTGGRAVYQARSLYALVNPEQEYDDYLNCLTEGIYWREDNTGSAQGYSSVSPNPADESLNLSWYGFSSPVTQVRLLDFTGRQLMAQWVSTDIATHTFDTRRIPSGIYQIIIEGEAGILGQHKIVINH